MPPCFALQIASKVTQPTGILMSPFLRLWVSWMVTIFAAVATTSLLKLFNFPLTNPAAFVENILIVFLATFVFTMPFLHFGLWDLLFRLCSCCFRCVLLLGNFETGCTSENPPGCECRDNSGLDHSPGRICKGPCRPFASYPGPCFSLGPWCSLLLFLPSWTSLTL